MRALCCGSAGAGFGFGRGGRGGGCVGPGRRRRGIEFGRGEAGEVKGLGRGARGRDGGGEGGFGSRWIVMELAERSCVGRRVILKMV